MISPRIRFPRPGPRPRDTGAAPWSVPDLCAAYSWPNRLAGGGVIGIIELGGGWRASDVAMYCATERILPPQIVDVAMDLTNAATGGDADGEVALDIQVAAASYFAATGRPAFIRMYWTSDMAAGIRKAVADGCDTISISWGNPENEWPAEQRLAVDQAAAEACQAGVAVFAAAGDNDGDDAERGAAHVDYPASCPYVVGCGGTRLPRGAAESVWNNTPTDPGGEGTGGGYSSIYPSASWQAGAPPGPGRMVPDVAGNADPETGYMIVLNGDWTAPGGTSAVAPLYAGLFAAFGRKPGQVLPILWANPAAFRDVTIGGNGVYQARVGPDPCTGLGSPVGTALAKLFVRSQPP